MDWFSFIAGALTGWIIEWLIDLFIGRANSHGGPTNTTVCRRTSPIHKIQSAACEPAKWS